MKSITLKNPDANTQLSFALTELVDLAKNQGMQVETKQKSDNTKGNLILEIGIILGEGVAANAIYDLLKYSLKRLGNRITGDTRIEIDEKNTTVAEVLKDRQDNAG
jgi:hypothetical protein